MNASTRHSELTTARSLKRGLVLLAALSLAGAGSVAAATKPDAKPGAKPAAAAPAPAAQPGKDDPTPLGEAGNIKPKEDVAPDPAVEGEARVMLSERLLELSQQTLRAPKIVEPMWRQSAALLRAGAKLSPNDSRLPRLLIDAELGAGNVEGAIEALNAYRKLAPDDRMAQRQLIDLYAGRLQSNDAKLAYLRDVLAKPSVPEDVKSHAAVLAALALRERSDKEALAMLDQVLRLHPLSPEALELRYKLSEAKASPYERAVGLMMILRSNPAQPRRVAELARLVASAGLHDEAMEWFKLAANLYSASGGGAPGEFHDLYVDYAAHLQMAGQRQGAAQLIEQLLDADDQDPEAWFLRLTQEKHSDDAGAYAATLDAAQGALTRRVAGVERILDGKPERDEPEAPAAEGEEAKAAPPEVPNVDPAALAKRINDTGDVDLANEFVLRAADLAWFEIYYNDQPGAAGKWIEAVAALNRPEDEVTLARLRGWSELVGGNDTEARAKLDPVADRDPLAGLGVVLIEEKEAKAEPASAKTEAKKAEKKPAAKKPAAAKAPTKKKAAKEAGPAAPAAGSRAAKLLGDNPYGVLGAMIHAALKEKGVQPAAHSLAEPLRSELAKFPKDWLTIIDDPKRFYVIKAEPLRRAHQYRQPMYGQVVITNVSKDYDLTVGPGGVIQPELWFDAELRGGGGQGQGFSGVAIERLAGYTVLKPGQGTRQFVRIDQGNLGMIMAQNPTPQLQVNAMVLTNPATRGKQVLPGPAGYRVPFNKFLTRTPFQIGSPAARRKALEAAEKGTPESKMRYLEMLAVYTRLIVANPQADAATKQVANEMFQKVVQARQDSVPAVRGWAGYIISGMVGGDRKAATISEMASDGHWENRLLALAAIGLDADQKPIAVDRAANDPEPVVKAYAEALVDLLNNPPAPPTTQGTEAGAARPEGEGATEEPAATQETVEKEKEKPEEGGDEVSGTEGEEVPEE